jgi:hypothetical protein
MRRLALLVFWLLVGVPTLAQTTNVSGTITDAAGQSWNYGNYQFTFQPSPSNPSSQYFWNGAPLNVSQVISGVLDSTGSFTGAMVPSNTSITPSGSTWTFQACPASTTACAQKTFTITGSTQSLTSSFTPPAIVLNLSNPPPGASAYSNSEIVSAERGSFYYNISDNTLHLCQTSPFPPCTWISIGGSSTSILPLNNTFTGSNTFTQTINGNISGSASTATTATNLSGPGSVSGVFSGNSNFTGNSTFADINSVVVVDGVKYPQTNAGIQAAVNATPVGGTLKIPNGTYALTATTGQQILVTQPINIVCDGWGSNLQLQAGAGSIPLLRIAPSGVGGFVSYGTRIQDCQFSTAVGGLGTYAIQVDTTTAGSMSNLVIEHIYTGCTNTGLYQCVLGSGFGTGSIFFNNPTGSGGIYHSGIYNSTLYGNFSLTRGGDAMQIVSDKFFENATSDAVYADFYPGCAEFRVVGNIFWIPLHLGAVTSGSVGAIEPFIAGNQFEPQNTSLTGSNGAMLDLDGSSGSSVLSASIVKNAFLIGSNSATLNAVRLNYAAQTEIGGRGAQNFFTITTGGACGASTCHAVLATVNAFATNWLNHNIYSTPTWSGSSGSILAAAGTAVRITEDSTNDPTQDLLFQASSGGTTLNGYNGALLLGDNGNNAITDGGSGTPKTAAVFSPRPSAISSPSGTTTGFIAAGGAQAVLTGTGACVSPTTQIGGAWAGSVICPGTTGASTLIITPGFLAQNGWSCWGNDITAGTAMVQSAVSANSCTLKGTVTASDVITFGAVAY